MATPDPARRFGPVSGKALRYLRKRPGKLVDTYELASHMNRTNPQMVQILRRLIEDLECRPGNGRIGVVEKLSVAVVYYPEDEHDQSP